MITKNNLKRIIINDSDGLYASIKDIISMYGEYYEEMDSAKFCEVLPTLNDTVILGYGRSLYNSLKELHDNGIIHIGLRKFNFSTFSDLSQVYIGTNKLIFSPSVTESWDRPVSDSTGQSHATDIRLAYFFSESIFKEPLTLPETRCVGLKEGIKILREEFIPDTEHQIGFDYETNGFPEWSGFNVSGFALSISDLGKAVFFDFRLDYNYDPANINDQVLADKSEFYKTFYEFVTTHKDRLWAYNCSFEILVLFWMYREFIPIQDSMALCVADDKRGTLKYNVQYYLNSPSWDDALDKQQNYIEGFTNEYPSYEDWEDSFNRWNYSETLEDGSIKYPEREKYSAQMEAMTEYHKNPEWVRMLKLNWGNSWFACDPYMLGVYCCYDAFYGERLANLMMPAYGTITMPDGSIGNGPYKAFLYNRYMGAELKLTGIKVNRDKLTKYKNYCENIQINYEVLANRFYLYLYFKDVGDEYESVDINDRLKNLLVKYPNCTVTDPMSFAKALVNYIACDETKITARYPLPPIQNADGTYSFPMGDEYKTTKGEYFVKVMDVQGTMDLSIFNDIIGYDVSDELSFINDYTYAGFNSFLRKRKCFSMLGDFLMNVLGMYDAISLFNKMALEVMQSRLNKFDSDMKTQWLYNIPLKQAYLLIDIVKYWKSRKSVNSVVIRNDNGEVIDSLLDRVKYQFPDFDESLTASLLCIPDSLKDSLYYYRECTEDNLKLDLSYIIPWDIINEFDVHSYPNINSYREYLIYKDIASELSRIHSDGRFTDDVLIDNLDGSVSKLDMSYIGRIMNYWSPQQSCNLFAIEKKFYAREVTALSALMEFIYRSGKYDGEYTYSAIKNLLMTKVVPNVDGLMRTDKYHYISDPDFIWGTDIGRTLAGQTGIASAFPYMTDDINGVFNNKLDDDVYLMLSKFHTMLDLAAVARKEYTTYIVALESGIRKVRYDKSDNHDGNYCGALNCGQFIEDPVNFDTYLPEFSINTVNTKRCSSGFHTFRHASDSMECLDVDEGRIKTYFDVSQMEPRSLAYICEDANFKGAYEEGKDAYMELAKVTWAKDYAAHNYDDAYIKEAYRPIAKTCLISKIYGRGNAGLAETAEVPIERVAEMEKALFNNWKDVAKYRTHKMNYLIATGEVETYLGDRLTGYPDSAYTTAVNWCNQGNTAIIANEDFENAILAIRNMGIEIWAESIVHDSNTNDIPINKLFECDFAYRRYFRMYCLEKYGIDFKYDLDISKDSCNNMSYKLKLQWVDEAGNKYLATNVSNRQLPRPEGWNSNWKLDKVGTISGNKEDVDYVMSHLDGITIINDEIKDQHSDPLMDFLNYSSIRSHLFCDLPEFVHKYSRKVTFHVDRYVEGEELFGLPLNEPYYFDVVKKWKEHVVPGLDDIDNSLEIKDNPNKVYPVEIMNKILRG